MNDDQIWLCDVLDELCHLIAQAWKTGHSPRAIVLNLAVYDAVARTRSLEQERSAPAISLLGFEVRGSESVPRERPELVFEHQ